MLFDNERRFMKDLAIMRDNFNKLIDYYERNGITVEDITKRNNFKMLEVYEQFEDFINTTVKESVPLFSEEVKLKFTLELVVLLNKASTTGMFSFLNIITDEKFINEILEGEENGKE